MPGLIYRGLTAHPGASRWVRSCLVSGRLHRWPREQSSGEREEAVAVILPS